jgi:hypothetical protein
VRVSDSTTVSNGQSPDNSPQPLAIDLLSRVNRATDELSYDTAAQRWQPGGWARVANGWQAAAAGRCLLRFPYEPPAAYRITVEAIPGNDDGGLWVPLRVGRAECYFTTNGFVKDGNATAAFAYVDGQVEKANETSRPHRSFTSGRPVRIDVDVDVKGDQAILVAFIDGAETCRYSGPTSRLSIPAHFTRMHDNSTVNFGVGTTDGAFVITKVELQERSK